MHTTTVSTLRDKKARGERITMLTAYDYATGTIADRAGIDAILVGDSLGMVALGHPDTLSVTMDEMVHHTKAVSRAVKNALLIADMPFLSYQVDPDAALANAGRFLKEAGADAVKLEGGAHWAKLVRELTAVGIPVLGHIGLTPQAVNQLGGFKVQGKAPAAIQTLRRDARALAAAGCFAIVLECVPAEVARLLTAELTIPTIGIGAGPHCDGQVLVCSDLWGLYDRFLPKFVKRYAELGNAAAKATAGYIREVRAGTFPDAAHSFHLDPKVARSLKKSWK